MNLPVLAYVAEFAFILPVTAGIYRWKKLSKPVKVLTIFFCFSLLIVAGEETLRRMHIHNLFLGKIHQVIEIQCFFYLYWKYSSSRVFKDGIQYAGMFYLLFWVVTQVYFDDPDKFNEIIATVANFALIVVSVLSLYELAQQATIPLHKYTMFWISAAIIIYSSGTIIIFSFSNSILALGNTYFSAFWHINWMLIIIVNSMFARSFWCKM